MSNTERQYIIIVVCPLSSRLQLKTTLMVSHVRTCVLCAYTRMLRRHIRTYNKIEAEKQTHRNTHTVHNTQAVCVISSNGKYWERQSDWPICVPCPIISWTERVEHNRPFRSHTHSQTAKTQTHTHIHIQFNLGRCRYKRRACVCWGDISFRIIYVFLPVVLWPLTVYIDVVAVVIAVLLAVIAITVVRTPTTYEITHTHRRRQCIDEFHVYNWQAGRQQQHPIGPFVRSLHYAYIFSIAFGRFHTHIHNVHYTRQAAISTAALRSTVKVKVCVLCLGAHSLPPSRRNKQSRRWWR